MANCTKIKYPTKDVAFRALTAIVAASNAGLKPKVPAAVYPCRECHAWHLTSKRHGRKHATWNLLNQSLSR